MTDSPFDETVFERAVVQRAADEHGVAVDRLTGLVDEHQSSVASLPGIENLVYEWRKQYEAPVIERTTDVYYLAVPDWVWEEFGDHLGVEDVELDALTDVHRQAVAAETDAEAQPPDGATYVVLDRRRDDG